MLYIGEKIKDRMEARGLTPTTLGKKIGTSSQNVQDIFKRQSIDAELLQKISKALDYDFFDFYKISSVSEPEAKYETIKSDKHELMLHLLTETLEEMFDKFAKITAPPVTKS